MPSMCPALESLLHRLIKPPRPTVPVLEVRNLKHGGGAGQMGEGVGVRAQKDSAGGGSRLWVWVDDFPRAQSKGVTGLGLSVETDHVLIKVCSVDFLAGLLRFPLGMGARKEATFY